MKARDERHAEVGDRANDAVRVDAEDLRARVVGEGGNLGFTQRARVAYALGGGRIFMDAIDNSAGVDCSDHEVNIKILLDAIVADGDLTGKQRNELLAEMTDEVAALVLRDNYDQAQALTSSATQAASMAEVHERYVRSLEQAGVLNRELEFLPSIEAFEERAAAGGGLTAPEFAILLSHTKVALSQALLASDLPDDPYLAGELALYFPTRLRERFPEQLERHSLRREIIATRIANDLVNRAGTTFLYRLGDETGAAPDEIARAYTAAREVAGLPRALGGDRGARRQGAGRDPDRDAAAFPDPARADDALAPPPPPPAARHRRDRRPLRARARPRSPRRCRRCWERRRSRRRRGARRRSPTTASRPTSRGTSRGCSRSSPPPTSSRSPPRRGSTSRRSPRRTSGSGSGSSCSGCATGSSACRATRAGPRWHGPPCATTSTRSRRA